MYRLTCDGLPLLDWRDVDFYLENPKVKLEVNTVGEGSFTIYKNHPNYSNLKKLKSVLEISDDNGVIFRGRAIKETKGFNHSMLVDLEGAMAYFNDSVVRPFNFPDDFQVSGDRVAFFLGWLIDNHNSQVQDFQKMKLGNVTVQDENFARSVSEYASTWEVLKAKLFESSLGGYLCIRYEADGNYIDYLAEFTETNGQEIVFGENLLDLKNETEASETYSAIIPIGALGLTLEGLDDGDITDDIVKSGDTLYSKKAVEAYGWIYAPTSATTWDEVVDDADLLTVGLDWLANNGFLLNAMEATAVDMHFTDEQVASLRIYKNVNVRSGPHGVAESFPLAKLEIELLNPQNTRITVGKTIKTLTKKTELQQDEAKKKYSKLSKTDEQIRLEVQDEIKKLSASIIETVEGITLSVSNGETSSSIKLMLGETQIDSAEIKFTGFVTFDGLSGGTTTIDGACIKTGTISADRIDADNLTVKAANISGTLSANQVNLTDAITWSDLAEDVTDEINDAWTMAYYAEQDAADAAKTVSGWRYGSTTYIDGEMLMTGTVKASSLMGGSVSLLDASENVAGVMSITSAITTSYAIDLTSYGGLRLNGSDGDAWLGNGGSSGQYLHLQASSETVTVGNADLRPNAKATYSCGTSSFTWSDVYAANATIQTSDREKKTDIVYGLDSYDTLFDAMQPVSFIFKDGNSGRRHLGMIAQDIEQSLADLGMNTLDFAGFIKSPKTDINGNVIEGEFEYALRYGECIPLLIDQVQKLKKRVLILEG